MEYSKIEFIFPSPKYHFPYTPVQDETSFERSARIENKKRPKLLRRIE